MKSSTVVAAVAAAALLAMPALGAPLDPAPSGAVQWTASLRGTVTLSDPSVHLSDLFTGIEHDRVIGPAPEPGGRIVVEAAQLAGIARQFGVDWQLTNATEHAVLERRGAPFARAQALAALRTALAVSGVPADAEIELPVYIPPMVPPDGTAEADVGQLDYDPSTGRFTALLSVTAMGMNPAHARLSGRVQLTVEVPITARRMFAGDVIKPGDIRLARVPARTVRADAVENPAQAVGMALRRSVAIGAPLAQGDLVRPLMVHRNGRVTMLLSSPGLALTAVGIAGEDGALGEFVRVINPASRTVVSAEVTGADQVRVEADVQPVVLPPGASLQSRLALR